MMEQFFYIGPCAKVHGPPDEISYFCLTELDEAFFVVNSQAGITTDKFAFLLPNHRRGVGSILDDMTEVVTYKESEPDWKELKHLLRDRYSDELERLGGKWNVEVVTVQLTYWM